MDCRSVSVRALALLACLHAMPGNAQSAEELAAYQAVNAKVPAPPVAEVAVEAKALFALMVERKQAACAPSAVEISSLAPATASRIAIEGIKAGQLKNVWTAYGLLKGCPTPTPVRLLVVRLADDSLIVRQVSSGETLTTASQMRDTSAQASVAALMAIRTAVPDCAGNDMAMGDTRIASKGADLGPDVYGTRFTGSWSEVWAFSMCGRTAEVPITFRADGSGGVYSDIAGKGIVLLPASR